jgi:hypothetical protein
MALFNIASGEFRCRPVLPKTVRPESKLLGNGARGVPEITCTSNLVQLYGTAF